MCSLVAICLHEFVNTSCCQFEIWQECRQVVNKHRLGIVSLWERRAVHVVSYRCSQSSSLVVSGGGGGGGDDGRTTVPRMVVSTLSECDFSLSVAVIFQRQWVCNDAVLGLQGYAESGQIPHPFQISFKRRKFNITLLIDVYSISCIYIFL